MGQLVSNKSQMKPREVHSRMNLDPANALSGVPSNRDAFTFVELMVVLCLLCVLMLTLFSAHGASRAKSQPIRCLDNMRQLMAAMMLYTHDNHDFFPPNPHDGTTLPRYDWCSGMAGAGE